jgi:hypothetical protein
MEQRVNTLAEKVARIEAQLEAQASQLESGQEDRDEMKTTLHEIRDKINKWEGKFGGILFILGCLWAFFSGALKAFAEWAKIKGDW